MVVKWQSGGPSVLTHRIQTKSQEVFELGEEIIRTTVAEAAADQAEALEDATTTTGDLRMATGRHPVGATAGRHVTGNMIDRITTGFQRAGNSLTGWWGWDNVEDYIGEQEDGVGRIPPAHSIFISFAIARESFIRRVRTAGRK